MRIVSLVPSLSKTVCDLGLKDQLVGITNFCVDPPDLHRTSMRVGGTKDPDLEKIAFLNPTHILVNEEENRPEDILDLSENYSVLKTLPKSLDDLVEVFQTLGTYLGRELESKELVKNYESELKKFNSQKLVHKKIGRKFIYLIWKNPWMSAGPDTYISRFLSFLGLTNAVDSTTRYPVLNSKEIRAMDYDVLFLSSEPWPFRRRDLKDLREEFGLSESLKIFWIDGKIMSWHGSTAIEALTLWNSGASYWPIKEWSD